MELIGPGGKTECPLPLSCAPRPTPLFRVVLMETKRAPGGACRPEDSRGEGRNRVEPPHGRTARRVDLSGKCRSGEVLAQPALDLGHRLALAPGVVLELV